MAERPDEVREKVVRNDNLTGEETEDLRRRAQSDDEVEAARADIELTRAEMSETVGALQEKIDPERLKEEAKERVKGSARDTGSQLLDTFRDNPTIPAAIVGGVIGLFLLRRLVRGGGGKSGGERVETVVLDLRSGSMRTS
ncbi:MAG: DUF3618 domain-containing protein [Rubrobacteraceae bacterium]